MIPVDMLVTVINPNSISPILHGERASRKSRLECFDEALGTRPRYRATELDRRVVHEVLRVALYPTVFGFNKIEDRVAESFEPIDRHRNDRVRLKPQVPGVD